MQKFRLLLIESKNKGFNAINMLRNITICKNLILKIKKLKVKNSNVNQKSALILNSLSYLELMTPAFWYSPTLLSKKLVLP